MHPLWHLTCIVGDFTFLGLSNQQRIHCAAMVCGVSGTIQDTQKLGKVGFFLTTEYLLNREVEHVLSALTPSNRLVCKVTLHTGLRINDVLSLKPEDLQPIVYITERKTHKRRRVGFPRPLLDELRQNSGKYWVFPSRLDPTKHRTRQAVWADVKRAAKAFRLRQNVAPHSFRKVYAVELMEKYGDIDRVRRALNHGSLMTTMIYVMADKILQQKRRRNRSAVDYPA